MAKARCERCQIQYNDDLFNSIFEGIV